MNFLPDQDESSRKPTQSELSLVLCSLVTSRAVLMEDGVTVSRKPEDERKLVLNLEREELQRVLGDTGGKMWKNILNA
jgi:origin recognition complex subunit 1